MGERKATEVLINIENMVKKILGHNTNQDLLLKTCISRIQALEAKLSNKPSITETKQLEQTSISPIAPKSQMPGLKPGVKLNIVPEEEVSFAPYNGEPKETEDADKLTVESAPVGKRRDSRYVESDNGSSSDLNRPVPVQQQLLYPDGRAISTAKVEIFSNGKLIKTLKTNATGKWTNALLSGDYIIKISKKDTSTQKSVDSQISVVVPQSNEPVQLQPFQVQ